MTADKDTDDDPLLFEQDQAETSWPIPRLFQEYGAAYKPLIAVALGASLLSPVVSLLPTYLLKVVIDSIFLQTTTFTVPLVPANWLPTHPQSQLLLSVGLIAGAAVTSSGLGWVSGWAWGRFAQTVQHIVRTDAYKKIQRLGISFFDDQQTGQILSILNDDVNELNRLLERFLDELLRIGARFIAIAAVLFYLHWQLAIIALIPVPVLAVMSRWFISRIRPKYDDVRQRVGVLNARIENSLSGIRVVKAYTSELFEANRVDDASKQLLNTRWDVITTRISFFPLMNVVNWLSFGVLVVIGGLWILNGPPLFFTEPLSVGTLVAFLTYNRQFTSPLIQVGHLVDLYHDARASVIRIFALKDYDIEIKNQENALSLVDIDGAVAYEDVTFRYETDEEPAIEDICFEVEPGAFVGIVGPTGSGKTTLTKLLPRFYDPDDGSIRLDGHELRSIALNDLRTAIGYVSQEPFLFSGTVSENIAYSTPNVSRAEIEQAARMAGAHEFITSLADGYETEVGERGVKLSGGQRQRIALARAIITDPDLLILDEATSHVDNETEVLIQTALRDFSAKRTTFAIAHRLSTVRHADTILVLDGGKIVEQGVHEELLEHDGLYANLWKVQVGELGDLPETFLEQTADADATFSIR